MLKYIVRDATAVLRNLPQGLVIGVLVVLVLSAIIDKVLKKEKDSFFSFGNYRIFNICDDYVVYHLHLTSGR